MAFRTLEITTPAKLDYSLNYLNCRTAENTKRFCLDELETVINRDLNQLREIVRESEASSEVKSSISKTILEFLDVQKYF